jgi:hypothetical protein
VRYEYSIDIDRSSEIRVVMREAGRINWPLALALKLNTGTVANSESFAAADYRISFQLLGSVLTGFLP